MKYNDKFNHLLFKFSCNQQNSKDRNSHIKYFIYNIFVFPDHQINNSINPSLKFKFLLVRLKFYIYYLNIF
jgi:hypothetical protein